MEGFIGIKCHAVGLTADNLISQITEIRLTNGIIQELASFLTNDHMKDVGEVLQCNPVSLRSAIGRVKGKCTHLKKYATENGKKVFQEYVESEFNLPQGRDHTERRTKPSTTTHCENCAHLVQGIEAVERSKEERVRHLEKKLEDCEKRRKEDRRKASRKLQDIHSIIGEVGQPSDVVKKMKRLQSSRSMWRRKFWALHSTHHHLKSRHRKALSRCQMYKRRHDRRNSKIAKDPRRRKQPLQSSTTLVDYVDDLHCNIDDLEARVEQFTKPLHTKEGKEYSSSIREVSYFLQDQGVAEHKVSEVIRTVMETLGHQPLESLPSTSTQARFSSEMKVISRDQVREGISGESDVTLKYDGTTKGRLGHLAEVEIETKSTTFVTGILQQAGGTALDYVGSIKSSCQEVQEDLLEKVSNTMTDRCATNSAVDRELEQHTGKPINSFRCAMHPLDSFARQANSILRSEDDKKAALSAHKGAMPYQKPGESSTQALLRAADKLFNNAASGDNMGLKSYLLDKGLPSSLPRWVGNRFNILFENSSLLFRSGDGIQEFFTKVQRPQNNLQRAFINAWTKDSKTPLRCLGLLHKTMMKPWKNMVGRDMPILEMNDLFLQARNTLQAWHHQPAKVLEGKTIFGHDIEDDEMWASLSQVPNEESEGVGILLSSLIHGLLEVVDRQLSSQLPDGEFWEPSPELRKAAESCASTNISGERNFALVDASLQRAPNLSIGKVESKIMFKANKTRRWLEQKPSEERRKVVKLAVQKGKKVRLEDKKKKEHFVEEVRKRVRDKQRKQSEKEERERDKIEELVEHVLEYGIWDGEEIEQHVHALSKTRASVLLRKQITFRTKILGKKLEKVAISKCSLDELKNLLCEIPVEEDNHFVRTIKDANYLVGQSVIHRWEDDGKDSWFNGVIEGLEKQELRIKYNDNDEAFYMTIGELLTDVYLEDIIIT